MSVPAVAPSTWTTVDAGSGEDIQPASRNANERSVSS